MSPANGCFPRGRALNAGAYMLVYASGKNAARGSGASLEYHTNFKLSPAGGVLVLNRPNGSGGWISGQPDRQRDDRVSEAAHGFSYGAASPASPGTLTYFLVDTPGAANNAASAVPEFCKDTTFDIDRGFYDAPFTLHITTLTPGATIVHTVNGSEPSATNGIQSPAPDAATPPVATISISDTTLIRARAIKAGIGPSDVDTQTYLFAARVLQQNGPPPSMNLAAGRYADLGNHWPERPHATRPRLGGRSGHREFDQPGKRFLRGAPQVDAGRLAGDQLAALLRTQHARVPTLSMAGSIRR